MPLIPDEWSVVIVGYWNRAILTPAWIAHELFKLPETTPIQVLVSLDTIAPHQVRHDKLTVITYSDRVVIRCEVKDFETLAQAMVIAQRILKELPRTPVSAAGFNIKYKSESMVESVQRVSIHEWWDNRISDAGFRIETRYIHRSLSWKDGKLRVFLSQEEDDKCEVLVNFDRLSEEHSLLIDWLSTSPEEIKNQFEKVVYASIGLSPEDFSNA